MNPTIQPGSSDITSHSEIVSPGSRSSNSCLAIIQNTPNDTLSWRKIAKNAPGPIVI